MTPEILTAVVVAILSSKLWDFLAARFKQKDEIEDKEDKVLRAISDLKKKKSELSVQKSMKMRQCWHVLISCGSMTS